MSHRWIDPFDRGITSFQKPELRTCINCAFTQQLMVKKQGRRKISSGWFPSFYKVNCKGKETIFYTYQLNDFYLEVCCIIPKKMGFGFIKKPLSRYQLLSYLKKINLSYSSNSDYALKIPILTKQIASDVIGIETLMKNIANHLNVESKYLMVKSFSELLDNIKYL